MSSFCAASITVAPFSTWIGRPSTSRFSIEAQGLEARGQDPGSGFGFPSILDPRSSVLVSYVIGDQTALVVDVVLELLAEMLDEALHRQRCGVAERADGASSDVVRDRNQRLEILGLALAVFDAVDHAPEPAGAFAARRALPTRFGKVEVREP